MLFDVNTIRDYPREECYVMLDFSISFKINEKLYGKINNFLQRRQERAERNK